jgi:hypothetical protein
MRIVPKEPAQLASTARISTPSHARVRLSPGRQADRGVQVDPRLVCNVHTGSTMVRWRTSTIDRRHHVIEAESIWRCEFGIVLQYFDTISDGLNRLQCDICGQSRAGVTIRCGDCPRRFHPACAWMSGYRFAFEMHSTVSDSKQALLQTCSLRRLCSIDRWQVSTRKGRSFDHHVQGGYRCLDAAVSVYRSLDLKGQAVL